MFRKLHVLFLVIGILQACNTPDPKTLPSIETKKVSSVVRPGLNQSMPLGVQVPFKISVPDSIKVDSITLKSGKETWTYFTNEFNWIPTSTKTGTLKIDLTVHMGANSETHFPRLKMLSDKAPERYSYTVKQTFPHNRSDYTQGLFFNGDTLYESTGQTGKSVIKKYNLGTGEIYKSANLGDEYFGEGSALYGNEIYMLTWQSNIGFVYDLKLKQKRTFRYSTEGWGLTAYNNFLVMSDGTEKLYFMDPATFTEVSRLEVYDHERAVDQLNELEAIDGLIYANVYQEDYLIAIDPESGKVVKKIELNGLLTAQEQKNADVLNGIAWDAKRKRLVVTGKWWPKLFEIELKQIKENI
jgi:glutaminyl-peptide cyclotransferase